MDPFTDHEWQTLQFAPLAALHAVATADGRMSHPEVDAFEAKLAQVAGLEVAQARLVRDVVASLLADYEVITQRFYDGQSGGLTVTTVLREAKTLLDTKAVPAEASTFRHVVRLLCVAVAEAAPLVGQKVTAQEQVAIDGVTSLLG